MYVRISSTDDELICPHFDEEQHRITRGLLLLEQGEFMVVWRKNRIELYRDYVGHPPEKCMRSPVFRISLARSG